MKIVRFHQRYQKDCQRYFRGKVSLFHQGREVGQAGLLASAQGIEIGRHQRLQIQLRYRGHGLGELLLKETIKYAQELQNHYAFSPSRIYAVTSVDNLIMQRLLERNGFAARRQGHRDIMYRLK